MGVPVSRNSKGYLASRRTVLSGRLKSLVGAGLLERRSSVEAKRPSYHLTEKGRAFFPVYVALKCWADDWSCSQEGVVTELFDARSGQRVRSAPLLREDGSEITCEDVVVWDRRLRTNSR
ncbi:winged helix-turn-helix transcriptional regulator [Cupriavidus sp. KK10]|jgi:hypothetical protein|uniref:winged helix-turn-helix transcriptional regulator n=1 Tax=Cupriavidus sp. KK10 TaxID=1478019 RepID=UPI0035304FF3